LSQGWTFSSVGRSEVHHEYINPSSGSTTYRWGYVLLPIVSAKISLKISSTTINLYFSFFNFSASFPRSRQDLLLYGLPLLTIKMTHVHPLPI
jgi:hypothetical protein